jgi:RecG-like helicase
MVEDLRLDSLEGVGPVTTRKLSDAGVHNVMDLIVRGPVDISEITGMEKNTKLHQGIQSSVSSVECYVCGKGLSEGHSITAKTLSNGIVLFCDVHYSMQQF